MRLESLKSGRLLIGPEKVHFRLTDLCNLTCQYCWEYGPNNTDRPTGKNHLPFDVFERVVRDLVDLRVDKIELSGIGDPTLHPRFYDILKCLEPSFTTTIFTNATFPIDRCRDILRADHIVINLGEADRASYRALQGKDLFMRVVKNIKELARLKPQINPNFRLEVVFIETRMNAHSFSKTEKLAKMLGADYIRKSSFDVSDHNRELLLSDQEVKTNTGGRWTPCYHGWFDSAILINGDVNVCCLMKRLTIGNILKSSFKDIWESDEYANVRTLALKGGKPFGSSDECINCRAVMRNQGIEAQLEKYKERRNS